MPLTLIGSAIDAEELQGQPETWANDRPVQLALRFNTLTEEPQPLENNNLPLLADGRAAAAGGQLRKRTITSIAQRRGSRASLTIRQGMDRLTYTAHVRIHSRQTQAQGNLDSRQAGFDSQKASAQASSASRQTERQSMAGTSSLGGGQAASQRSGGGLSGYQSGASARTHSGRGSGSLSGSRSSRR